MRWMAGVLSMGGILFLASDAALAQGWPPWAQELFGPSYEYEPRRQLPEPRSQRERRDSTNDVREGGARPSIAPAAPPLVKFPHNFPANSIVIDTGGRDTTSQRAALSVADVLLVPFVPRSFDVWTLEKVAGVVSEIQTVNDKLVAFAFLNRADARGKDNEEAASVIRETPALAFLDTPLGTRKAFANAGALGLAVCELTPEDAKAAAEITTLYKRLFDLTPTLSAVAE